MPAKKRIFREDILAASVNVIRKWGPDGLSVRHIAQALGASTQPIYSEFHSLEALKAALLDHVREKFLRFRSTNYKDFALAFLHFAKAEPQLFKFMYLRQRDPREKLLDDVNLELTVSLLAKSLDMPLAIAREMHQRMQYYCYALGVMIATDYRDLSETELSRELTDLLCIMLGHYKGVRSEAELGPWLEKARHLLS